jgi:peptidoglycan hydrolase-like protein with peptidoglycan-binding domain
MVVQNSDRYLDSDGHGAAKCRVGGARYIIPSVPAPVRTSNSALTGDALRKDDIRRAQLELRNRGLYRGSLDGILGPETRHAVSQFQTINGLTRTASLDVLTWEALTSNPAIGGGPSTPDRSNSTTNSSAVSDLGG